MYIFSQSSVGSQELGNTLLALLKESTVITFMQISFKNIVQPLPIKVLKFDTVVAIYCTETSKGKKRENASSSIFTAPLQEIFSFLMPGT